MRFVSSIRSSRRRALIAITSALLVVTASFATVFAAEPAPAFLFFWSTSNDAFAIDVNADGDVYVADTFFHCIRKYDLDGNALLSWGKNCSAGTLGSLDGEFNNPSGLAVDSSGNVFVADTNNARIQKFTSTGTHLLSFGTPGSATSTFDKPGQFDNPTGVAVDSVGNIYVADANNRRVQKFNSVGTFITAWGTLGTGDLQFGIIDDIAIDGSDNVYTVDRTNHRVQKFSSGGGFITKWGKGGGDGTPGTADGEFDQAVGVGIGPDGNVFVADKGNDRLQKFSPTGTHLMSTTDGYALSAGDVAVGPSRRIYVTSPGDNKVLAYTSVPDIPSITGATPTSDSANQITWSVPNSGASSITQYTVLAGLSGGSLSAVFTGLATTFSHTGLNASTTYDYRVMATNALGTSGKSAIASVTTNAAGPTVPSAPQSPGAVADSATQITVSWSAPASNGGSAITGYRVERSPSGGGSFASIATPSSGATSFVDTGLTGATTYDYRIFAINAVGDSVATSTVSATTDTPPPAADLAIAKTSSPAIALINQNITYTLTATNNGPATATTVTISDPLPAGVAFVSGTGTCVHTGEPTGGTVTCTIASLANGASAAFDVVVTVPGTFGTISNTATVSAASPADNNSSNDSVTLNTSVGSPPGVPGLTTWGFGALAMMLGAAAFFMQRRRVQTL